MRFWPWHLHVSIPTTEQPMYALVRCRSNPLCNNKWLIYYVDVRVIYGKLSFTSGKQISRSFCPIRERPFDFYGGGGGQEDFPKKNFPACLRKRLRTPIPVFALQNPPFALWNLPLALRNQLSQSKICISHSVKCFMHSSRLHYVLWEWLYAL